MQLHSTTTPTFVEKGPGGCRSLNVQCQHLGLKYIKLSKILRINGSILKGTYVGICGLLGSIKNYPMICGDREKYTEKVMYLDRLTRYIQLET